MKTTSYLCSILLVTCIMHHVWSIPNANYPLDYSRDTSSSNIIADTNVVSKRDAPSLSIVNPLDVLRKRLLLEMARRQMKENTRQVERNRAILKNVGKRINQQTPTTFENIMMPMIEDVVLPYTQQQKQLFKQLHMYPNVHSIPTTSILDYEYVKHPSAGITTNLLDTNSRRFNNEEAMHGDEIVETGRHMSMNDLIADNDYHNSNNDYSDGVPITALTNEQNDEENAQRYEYINTLLQHTSRRWPDNIQLQTMTNQAVNDQQQQKQQQQLKTTYNETNSIW